MFLENTTKRNVVMDMMDKVTDLFSSNIYILMFILFLHMFQFKKSYSMLQTEKDLKMRMETLSNEKAERFRKFNHFKDQDQHLCDIMCLTPYYIPSGSTPTLEQLQALENHVASLKIEKVKIK